MPRTEEKMQVRTTLVLGGTGKTGRRVAERLTARGLPIRIGSRTGTPAFDWEDQATWAPALDGMDAVYITYYPDLAVPGAAEAIRCFAAAALENDVRRLVLLSGRGEEGAQLAERALQESGANWTILRASWFAQNFSESLLLEGVQSGVVALPVGGVTEPFIDAEDIADAAVAALTQEGHVGRLYELTGPRLLTFAAATQEIAAAAGRDIRYLQLSPEEFVAALQEQTLPAEVVWLVTELFTVILDGRNSQLTDGVERVLGRKPRDFADYARDTAATGIWAT